MLTAPRRFSASWWLVLAIATLVCGAGTFQLLSEYRLEKSLWLACWLGLTLLWDVLVAIWMEAVAPTRVRVGPGERHLDEDPVTEVALVIADFNAAGKGRVSIRGETWDAVTDPGSTIRLCSGMKVEVVDRQGLTLIVAPK
jgi:membrane protein implicated in regulation of membrane protease activity